MLYWITYKLTPGFDLGSMGHLACIMSHSLANCCQMPASCRCHFTLFLTESAWRSNVVRGTGYVGVGRAPSAAACPEVVDHLYWEASAFWRVPAFAGLARRDNSLWVRWDVRSVSSWLKRCGGGDLTMGFSEARRMVEGITSLWEYIILETIVQAKLSTRTSKCGIAACGLLRMLRTLSAKVQFLAASASEASTFGACE